MTMYTFQDIIAGIEDSSITTTSNSQIYITRQAYITLITNSSGNISFINLPLLAISIIDFNVTYFNFNPAFPFVASDFTTATDWVTYTLPT